MKTFRFIFIILMIGTFLAVISGAHHQVVFFLISSICYAVINGEIRKTAKAKSPYSRTFNADNL